jgi:hypothetical protein
LASSPDFPTKNAFQPTLGGSFDAFVTKFDPTGNLVYSTFLGGSHTLPQASVQEAIDDGAGIAVDAHGNAYVIGSTQSADFPTKNAFQNTLRGYSAAFVTKFEVAGNALVYSTYLGGSGNPQLAAADGAYSIAVDAQGNAYVTGFSYSADFPTKNAFQKMLRGQVDAFVTKLDAAGTALIYSTYLGGSGIDDGSGIAVDKRGEAYVTGYTRSSDFPTKNAFQPMLGGPFAIANAFVTKVSAR